MAEHRAAEAPPSLPVGVETAAKRSFASVLDWPGWSRAGRDEIAALRVAAPRYAVVVAAAGLDAPAEASPLVIVERRPGTATTDFGAPDVAFAADGRSVGMRLREPAAGDVAMREANRAAILEVLRGASDGSPVEGGRWPARYAARRIAWHALDHAWEIEDRSAPGG